MDSPSPYNDVTAQMPASVITSRVLDHLGSRFSNSTGSDGGPTLDPTPPNSDDSSDAYEFVAFLLWYVFLVICCVLPTCCAYRRRRLIEARIQQQQADFEQIQQQSLFILNNLQIQRSSHRRDGEEVRAERTRRLAEELKETTFLVKAEHIAKREEGETSSSSSVPQPAAATATVTPTDPREDATATQAAEEDDRKVAANDDVDEVETKPDDIVDVTADTAAASAAKADDIETGDTATSVKTAAAVPAAPAVTTVTEDTETDDIPMDSDFDDAVLRLPDISPNGNRDVLGGCAICLSSYEIDDVVCFSKKVECQHAFHKDCIIPWLAKKDEPRCPCCRQEFCTIEPITSNDPFSMHVTRPRIPSNFSTNFGILPLRTVHRGLGPATIIEVTSTMTTTGPRSSISFLPTRDPNLPLTTQASDNHLTNAADVTDVEQPQQR